MSEELPPIRALDKAAKANGYYDWLHTRYEDPKVRRAIIAHARTIAQYEQAPVDEDSMLIARFLRTAGFGSAALRFERGEMDSAEQVALAQFKRELEGRK